MLLLKTALVFFFSKDQLAITKKASLYSVKSYSDGLSFLSQETEHTRQGRSRGSLLFNRLENRTVQTIIIHYYLQIKQLFLEFLLSLIF